jgi:chondroitin 4-sulfotransferase 11
MISNKHKFIFIHIPRSGGSSIESQFNYEEGKEKNKHWTLNNWKKHLEPEIFNNYFKFGFVRNPWDQTISKYCAPFFRKINKSLKYFLEHYKTPKHERGETFFEYFDPKRMDFIGRFENRENDLSYISERIGVTLDSNIKLRQIQVAPWATHNKHYTEYYDDETREIVAEKYAKDIEYFGYKFGE